MVFQTPITIAKALERIQKREYVLPAIQREFVWKPPQICRLFDSLMLGYPIGAFLFWNVDGNTSGAYTYYGVMHHYHQLTSPHCEKLDLPDGETVTAILDGQQRLTALNIGLRGSHAEKLPRKWWNNIDAYPVKTLHLNLARRASENELRMVYDFQFLTQDQAETMTEGGDDHWFQVGKVLGMEAGPQVFRSIQTAGLAEHPQAFDDLHKLQQVVNEQPTISFFNEEEQDLDKVLNIFIRVNSGGTALSYSDLLLSIATAQWTGRDARDEINGLVDALNATGQGFAFSKDLVLKAGLVLADISDIRFKVTNFDHANMATLETEWDGIASSLRIAANLLASFGLNDRTLTADSVLVPIAYYVRHRKLDPDYLTAVRHQADRERIRSWTLRSLLKSGIWGSGLDSLLSNLRRSFRDSSQDGFPTERIETEMRRLGKSLRFQIEELEDLLSLEYGKARTFGVLALLYPGVDVRNEFHVDHIFPRSRFTKKRLIHAGIDPDLVEDFQGSRDRLPNLQLLSGPDNVQKQEMFPAAWVEQRFPADGARASYLSSNDLDSLPTGMDGFLSFYEARRSVMMARLAGMLESPDTEGSVDG